MNIQGDLTLTGNINLTTAIKAADDVMLNGEVKNTNESVICSENGDIVIDSANVNLNGLVYAPNGNVQITAQNLNMNSVVIMAQTITVNAPSVNANYSNSIAEFVGTESEVDFELSAFGEYSSESNSINIFWTSTTPRGSYEIQVSDDNITYTTIDVVEESDSYDYLIAEEFAKRYFKVTETTYYGEVLSTLPFVAEKAGDGYVIQFLDTDEDGIPDVFEGNYSTDPMNPDTDNDGLSDFEEIYLTQTDPNVWDSVNEGMSDAEIDCDGDGISNINEIAVGTNPLKIDTDEDGLSDSDENNLYATNPLLYDTDEDGISDGSEVKMGLSPTNPATYGTSDSEYQVEQSILPDSEVFAEINTADSPYKLSLDLKTNKFAEDEVYVYQSGYSSSIENDALLGKSIEVEINDSCNFSDIVLKYEIEEVYIENAVGTYAEYEEFQGIKRFNVFKFFDEINMLLPIETQYDIENNTVYAEINECGTYCVMDMEIWLDKLTAELGNDQEDDENVETVSAYSLRTASDGETTTLSETETDSTQLSVNAFLDIVFMVQTSGNNSRAYSSQINAIKGFSKYIFANFSNVNVYVIECDVNSARLLQTGYGSECFTDNDSLTIALNAISYSFTNEECQSHNAFSLLFNNISLRNNEYAYIYNFINGNTRFDENFDPIEISERSIGIYSQIMSEGYYTENATGYIGKVLSAIKTMGGLNIPTDSSTTVKLIDHLNENTQPKPTKYNALIGTNWKTVVLDDQLNADNGVNSDTDTLTDWQEVDIDLLIWNDDGTFHLPSLNQLLSELDGTDQNSIHSVFSHKATENTVVNEHFGDRLKVLPVLSDPTNEDTEGDGMNDDSDPNPIKVDLNYNLDFSKAVFESFDEYLNLIMPPVYTDKGEIITYQNCHCAETEMYFDVIIWPYLQQEYLKNDRMLFLSDSSTIRSSEYNKFLTENYCSPYDSPLLIFVNNIKDKTSTFCKALCYELQNPHETHEKAMKQLFGGNYSKDVTITGTVFQVVLGITGLDLVADIRDISYDIGKWCLGWELNIDNIFQTTVDAVAFLPVIGSAKYADEIMLLMKHDPDAAADLLKTTSLKLVDETGNIVGNSDEVVEMARAAALEALTSNSENAARLSKFIQKYGTEPFEQNNALLQSVLKLNNESADAFLTVASKQGKKFFEALENCDGYLDEVIEMTIKKGDAYAAVLVKANAKGGADYLKTVINGASLSDEVLLSGKSVEQGSDYWRSISSYYETMVDVIKSNYKNLGNNNAYTELNIITSNGNLEKSIKATSSTKKIDGFVELRGDKDASIDPERFFTTKYVSAYNEVSDVHIPNSNWNRAVDTEAKTLEEIARNLGASKNGDGIVTWGDTSATGTINLFTELPPCASCADVIKQFEKAYPNIKVNVFWKT